MPAIARKSALNPEPPVNNGYRAVAGIAIYYGYVSVPLDLAYRTRAACGNGSRNKIGGQSLCIPHNAGMRNEG